jgi:hypothetical protein
MIPRVINSCGGHTVANINLSGALRVLGCAMGHLRPNHRAPAEVTDRSAGRLCTAPICKYTLSDQAKILPETKQSRPTDRPAGRHPTNPLRRGSKTTTSSCATPGLGPEVGQQHHQPNTTHTWLGTSMLVEIKPTLPTCQARLTDAAPDQPGRHGRVNQPSCFTLPGTLVAPCQCPGRHVQGFPSREVVRVWHPWAWHGWSGEGEEE